MASRRKEPLSDDDNYPPLKRFRKSRSKEEEKEILQEAVPLSTRYKNKWAVNVFLEWIEARTNKVACLEPTTFDVQLENIDRLDREWEKMTAPLLNFWISKFVLEVADKKGNAYPARTVYQIVAGLKRHLDLKNRTDVNFFDKSNIW